MHRSTFWLRPWRGRPRPSYPRTALLLGFKVTAGLLLVLVVANQLTYLHDRHVVPKPSQFRDKGHFVTSWSAPLTAPGADRSGEVKTLLLWTRLFFSKDWGLHSAGGFQPCHVSNCRIVEDKSLLPHSHAVLFHSRNLFELRTDYPELRRPDQVWILHNLEPPYFVYDSLAPWNGLFNWTSSYRLDSDLVSPYGRTVRKTWSSHSSQDTDVWSTKTAMVLFISSNCRDYARRYRVVHELESLLPVDKYGNCHRQRCGKNAMCDDVFKRYKFYLAFENGYCRDYVTEKLWRALSRDQIPIVFGGADYDAIAPPHSFIRAADFPSMKALASYVLKVSRDATLYNSYFRWRSHFTTKMYVQALDWCSLCAALHNHTHRPPQVYHDLEGWLAEDSCPRYSYIDDFFATVDLVMFYIGL